MPLLDLLRLLEPVAHISEVGVAVFHVLSNYSHARVTRLIRANGRRVAAVNHAKWRLSERRLVRRIVDILGPRKPAEPLTWAIAGEAAQVHHDDAVGRLRLAIGLGVERRRLVQLGPHEAHELTPERRSEDRVAVGHHRLRHTM